MIKPKDFIDAVDDDRVTAAIRAAELHTSSEFRVFVSHVAAADPVAAAGKQFARLKMHATRHRNAVLIFIAPKSRTFALYADTAAHAHVSQPVWDRLSAETGEHFKRAGYTDGIIHVLHALGEVLSTAFPVEPGLGNELSDGIERG